MEAWTADINALDINPESKFYSWLITPQTLSIALKKFCTTLSVQILKQSLGTATADEQQALNIAENNSFIREVYLCGDTTPWVHARVIAPNNTYLKFQEQLDNLGTNLLGEHFLYRQSNVERSPFSYSSKHNIYARRSIFFVAAAPLLVTEHFLEQIPILF
jgi:chorismate--pyruvate lyase